MLVDEYQDTNHAQYVLVTELAGQQLPGADRGGEPAAPSPPAAPPVSSRISMYWAWLVSWYSSTSTWRTRRR